MKDEFVDLVGELQKQTYSSVTMCLGISHEAKTSTAEREQQLKRGRNASPKSDSSIYRIEENGH
jgi:hypothetical protein